MFEVLTRCGGEQRKMEGRDRDKEGCRDVEHTHSTHTYPNTPQKKK